MNKRNIIIGVILLILLVGCALVFSKKSVAPQKEEGTRMMKPDTPSQAQSPMMSLSELLTSGKTQSCSYDYTDDTTGKMSGKVFLSGGKMRSDYSITDKSGKETTGSVINDGTNMYMWLSSMPQGIKIAVTEEMKKDIANSQGEAAKYVDMNKKVNYRCDAWTMNSTSFTPPSNVQFMDYSSVMKKSPQITDDPENLQQYKGMKEMQCQSCDSLEDAPEKAQCKAALKCS